MGPFDSCELAKSGAKDYLAFLNKADRHMLSVLRTPPKVSELPPLKLRHA